MKVTESSPAPMSRGAWAALRVHGQDRDALLECITAIVAGFIVLVAADSPWTKERFLSWFERPKRRPIKRAIKRLPRKILRGVLYALRKGIGLA